MTRDVDHGAFEFDLDQIVHYVQCDMIISTLALNRLPLWALVFQNREAKSAPWRLVDNNGDGAGIIADFWADGES